MPYFPPGEPEITREEFSQEGAGPRNSWVPTLQEHAEALMKAALTKALALADDNTDAGAEISLAYAASNVLAGIASAEEIKDIGCYRVAEGGEDFEYLEPEPQCTCPPELVAAGGFKSGCPARGFAHG